VRTSITRNIFWNDISVIVQRLRLKLEHTIQQRVVLLIGLVSPHYFRQVFTGCIFVVNLR
jgi:hypothetical protein